MPAWLEELIFIGLLLLVVAGVIARLPKVEGIEHSKAFRRRRVMNWLPLGLTYAFLYMGRYNLTVSKGALEEMPDAAGNALMGNADFGVIFLVGTLVYGIAFVLNGPLTDRIGGKRAILIGAGGSAVANLLMGAVCWSLVTHGDWAALFARNFVLLFSMLYGLNMYFQSFGAVAIVKVNAPWFHVRERGVFGAIFGILISLGIYFAFDWSRIVLSGLGLVAVFVVPAVVLAVFWIIDVFMVADSPAHAGLQDFDTSDASSGDTGPQLGAVQVFKLMLGNPVILTIAGIEFCTGFLRQAIMQWYRTFAKQTHGTLELMDSYVYQHWGMFLCCAGILGGVIAGIISDRVFRSRRGPVACVLYAAMLVGALVLTVTYDTPAVGAVVVIMSMCVIGVHGMLSGTASMDFGGRKNVGVVVGIIDGFVYLGTAVMSGVYALLLPQEQLTADGKLTGEALDPAAWIYWPVAMIPLALMGTLLAQRVWNATPQRQTQTTAQANRTAA